MIDYKLPPHSDDAELAVLSAILERNSLIDDLEDLLRAEHFYRPDNMVIYRRMLAMSFANQPIDAVTLCSALDDAGETDDNTIEHILRLAENTAGSHNALHYARIVKDRAVSRNLIHKGNEITQIGYGEGEAQEKLDKAQSLIMDETEEAAGETESPTEVLRKVVEKVDYLATNQGKITGIPTGFIDLDKTVNGLQDSDLIIVAGRPGMGKSTVAMNICEYAAVKADKTILFFSLEMSSEQLMMRSVSALSGVPADKYKRGLLEGDDWPKFNKSISDLKSSGLYINDRSSMTSEQLLSRSRKLQKKLGKKVDLIVVDYLQLMNDKGEGVERVTKISRNLKLTAKEMNCPVIAVSQLSRKCEERANKRPVPSDLRESGAIEQDADIICFIYRDEMYNEYSNMKGVAELIIAKHRNGEIGTVYLNSQLHVCRFKDNLNYRPPIEPKTIQRGFAS